ncbi:MAG: carboxypeptidase M32 [Flavobacteriales bacterium]
MNKLYNKYTEHLRQIADLKGALALLHWDQETYLPLNAACTRARQIGTLNSLTHTLLCKKSFRSLCEKLIDQLPDGTKEKNNVLVTLHDLNRLEKLPAKHVEKLNKTISESFHAWQDARTNNNFNLFKPYLTKILDLKYKEAEFISPDEHPYNVMLDEFDKGLKVDETDRIFSQLKIILKDLIPKIVQAQDILPDLLNKELFSHQKQWETGIEVSKILGYQYAIGRKDLSTHPFTVSMSPTDVRITTRIDENNFMEMLWSTIHEVGHAVYEQGLNELDYGLPSGEACSIAIHESQSRYFENNIGKSIPFLRNLWNLLDNNFGAQFSDISNDTFYKLVNHISPSLIRINADELTYHYHIMIRYDIEKMLFEGKIKPKELPDAWNAAYQKYLNITPNNIAEGVLQDVHWAHGSFGYFPVYSIGSLYAAQFEKIMSDQMSDYESHIKNLQFKDIIGWLKTNIYSKGRLMSSGNLCQNITGRKLNPEFFNAYIQKKYGELYGINFDLNTKEQNSEIRETSSDTLQTVHGL